MNIDQFLADVKAEVERARKLFPGPNNHQTLAFAEEAGELVQAVLDRHYGKAGDAEVYAEAVQAAAMAARVVLDGDGVRG